MSETPRTDAKETETLGLVLQTHAHYGWKFARTLERELAAATRERDEARAQAGEANDERLNADARWTEIIADELAENRRLMDLGGALEDENFSAFVERVIAERDARRADDERPQMETES